MEYFGRNHYILARVERTSVVDRLIRALKRFIPIGGNQFQTGGYE